MTESDILYTVKAIKELSSSFRLYLDEHFCESGIIHVLDEISRKRKNVYIFSGLIRDFFLKSVDAPRDIDVVVSGDDLESLWQNNVVKKNQFGGTKIQYGETILDIWCMKNTWGIKRKKVFCNVDELLNTSFFNFSAIAYDYKNNKFIVGDSFVDFLNNRTLDLVYDENPYPELCIINSLYYSHKTGCRLSDRLNQWIFRHYNENIYDYDAAQLNHFGKVLYSRNDLDVFVESLNKYC